jgi:hypothetical protein
MFLALSKIWPESVKQMSVELMYCATRSTAISLLHTPRSSKSAYYKDNCIPMFTVVLFTIVKLWNQPRVPSRDEQIKKTWYSYTIGS